MGTKAFGYLRVSGRGQVKGHGLKRQREIVQEYATRHGIDLVHIYTDSHTGTEADRPAFVEMLGEILGNGVRVVIVECLDRLARDLIVQTTLLAKLESEGVTLISASTGEDVTASMRDDPMRKALVQIQGVFAELDKSLLVRKLRKGREAKRASEGRCEGRKPFGAMDGEQDTLSRIRQLRRKPRNGERRSYGEVARTLNRESRPSRSGRPWTRGTVHAVCKRLGW